MRGQTQTRTLDACSLNDKQQLSTVSSFYTAARADIDWEINPLATKLTDNLQPRKKISSDPVTSSRYKLRAHAGSRCNERYATMKSDSKSLVLYLVWLILQEILPAILSALLSLYYAL